VVVFVMEVSGYVEHKFQEGVDETMKKRKKSWTERNKTQRARETEDVFGYSS